MADDEDEDTSDQVAELDDVPEGDVAFQDDACEDIPCEPYEEGE